MKDRNATLYGKLTVLRIHPGRKNQHRIARCRCACGKFRTVRMDRLYRQEVKECRWCVMETARAEGRLARKRFSVLEKAVRDSFGSYRGNAKRKKISFDLSLDQFRILVLRACEYCGEKHRPNGVDRSDNSMGYSLRNCVPCCSICNYAKRERSTSEFFAWIERVQAHAVHFRRKRSSRRT